ncbi:MAG: hypothetical protein E4G91_05465 [Candidatus Zixiibacteriota bacterium]|nr:MAG: hypothetical protein E4G91_05465 [candidate division Zixibacteria bacterium]
MRKLLWLGAVIGALLLSSCGGSEKKTSPQNEIGDEEYRVMSAVLKYLKAESMQIHDSTVCVNAPKGADSAEIALLWEVKKAKQDSLIGKYGRLYIYVRKDTIHAGEFYDTLVQRFGQAAFYIVRDSFNGKVAYDSLHKRYGNLDYYMTLRDSTQRNFVDSATFDTINTYGLLTPDLIESYNRVCANSRMLERDKFGDSLVPDLVSERMREMSGTVHNFWSEFHKTYPLSDGRREISRVGFNKDTSTALVYFGWRNGPRGGGGGIILLRKQAGKWAITSRVRTWGG